MELRPEEPRDDPVYSVFDDSVRLKDDLGWAIASTDYRIPWCGERADVWRARPYLPGWPPAAREQLTALSDVHLFIHGSVYPYSNRPRTRFAELEDGAPPMAVVAESGDVQRWDRDGLDYLAQIEAATIEIGEYWLAHHRSLRWPGPLRGPRKRWEKLLHTQCARLVAASEHYRPVIQEIRESADAVAQARSEVTEQLRVVHDWDRRTRWKLVRGSRRSVRIVRAELAGARAPLRRRSAPGTDTGPLRDVHQRAGWLRHSDLRRIVWDAASIAQCDSELAELLARLPVHAPGKWLAARLGELPADCGHLGSMKDGSPLLILAPATLAGWYGLVFDRPFVELTDRAALREDRRRRL